ncbi:MAG: SDR family oxidoreductase [Candidatus Acidulodesulfobacterium ferriphilum]|jgi:Nucleoside-diphosphate-sugar epimerases|uniref:SDR family oxidoreductase n=1 Tax=Candidatus Acidulodesulfobacterium ferriphilum TaxID=2597223 RepID=A0A519BBJ4_9DELT|nr:MAG: SDR family oxidoreductase [Candidatus Acidulodesulfobacterium ferriphilum]
MKVLITGGAGFIGSNLCERLLNMGHEVLCLDNFYTGSKNNIAEFLGNSKFEVIRQDISEPFLIEADFIINLACPASVPHYQKDPLKTMKDNVYGIFNVMENVRRLKIPVLHTSTSEVYGSPGVHPQPESYNGNVNPVSIRSCYDEGKRAAETIMFDYHRQYGADIKVVRVFNTYGPKMLENDGRVVSNFIIQALKGDDLTVYGDGRQTRSFCYISDLIDGIVLFMENKSEFTGPVNLGNNYEFTVIDFAKLVMSLTGSKSKIRFVELPKDDPVQRNPDLTLARKILGYNPKVDIEEGLKKTISYFGRVLKR